MSTVAEIKEAIDRLSPQEYCELMSVLHPFDDDDWDRQMKADAAAGRFVAMNERAERSRAVMGGECDKHTAYGRRSDFGGAARSELPELACPAEWFGVSSNI